MHRIYEYEVTDILAEENLLEIFFRPALSYIRDCQERYGQKAVSMPWTALPI